MDDGFKTTWTLRNTKDCNAGFNEPTMDWLLDNNFRLGNHDNWMVLRSRAGTQFGANLLEHFQPAVSRLLLYNSNQ